MVNFLVYIYLFSVFSVFNFFHLILFSANFTRFW